VKLVDTGAELAEIGAEVEAAILRVVRSGRFIGGPELEGFESAFSEAVGGRKVAGVNSGTDALRLALQALDVGPGDEVIIPANTFTATAMAVEAVGATPVIADVDEALYVTTADLIEPLITQQTRCILPVHLFGHPAPMASIMDLAKRHDLVVIEDAAQAHGAVCDGRPAGAWGDAAAFSFYPSKNLGAYGDAGAVVGDQGLVDRVRVLRDLGRDANGAHIEVAINSRMDAIQAAVLTTKLQYLQRWRDQRRRLAARYVQLLSKLPVGLPEEGAEATHVYHLFVIRVAQRDVVRQRMMEQGVETGIHYPEPIHFQRAHEGRVKVPNGAPVAESMSGEILSLPLYPQMTDEIQKRVAAALESALVAVRDADETLD
jgi:dTDP-4-amino-4,6-dideoxygalactose transaminase